MLALLSLPVAYSFSCSLWPFLPTHWNLSLSPLLGPFRLPFGCWISAFLCFFLELLCSLSLLAFISCSESFVLSFAFSPVLAFCCLTDPCQCLFGFRYNPAHLFLQLTPPFLPFSFLLSLTFCPYVLLSQLISACLSMCLIGFCSLFLLFSVSCVPLSLLLPRRYVFLKLCVNRALCPCADFVFSFFSFSALRLTLATFSGPLITDGPWESGVLSLLLADTLQTPRRLTME